MVEQVLGDDLGGRISVGELRKIIQATVVPPRKAFLQLAAHSVDARAIYLLVKQGQGTSIDDVRRVAGSL